MRFFAYKLASVSRQNLGREASKAEPRLHRVLGHASLFERTKCFIEAAEAGDIDELESLDEFDEGEDDDIFYMSDEEDDPPSGLHVTNVGDAAPAPRHMLPKAFGSSNVCTVHGNERGSERELGISGMKAREITVEDDQPYEPEIESDLSTEVADDDYDDEDNWSDSTCAYSDDDETHAGYKFEDSLPIKVSQYSAPKHEPLNGDLVPWAQQPSYSITSTSTTADSAYRRL